MEKLYVLFSEKLNKPLVVCKVKITKIIDNEIACFKVIECLLDDSGNFFYKAAKKHQWELTGSLIYLHDICE